LLIKRILLLNDFDLGRPEGFDGLIAANDFDEVNLQRLIGGFEIPLKLRYLVQPRSLVYALSMTIEPLDSFVRQSDFLIAEQYR
jgi:hypothetical protein